MKRHLKTKQFEPLHNALGVMTAEVANVEDSFHHGRTAARMRRYNQVTLQNLGMSHSSCLLVVFLLV